MATFEVQVEGLTSLTISNSGTAPTQAELTQFLTDGAKEVINSLPGHLLPLCATSQSFTSGTVDKLNTGKILNVFRSDGDINQPCRKIPAKQKGRVSDPEDMAYATITDPIYYIDNNSLDVLPAGGSCTYSEVQYPAVAYGDSTITESTVTGMTVTKANPAVFTASSHGFSVNDILELSSFTEMSELNDITAKVASVPSANTFTLTGIDSSNYGAAETTGATAVKSTGFPDEAEHLVALYGAVKSLQNVLGDKSSNSDITTAIDAANTELDKIVTDVHVPVAPAINEISYTDATNQDASTTVVATATATSISKADISGNVPTFTKPVVALDFAQVNTHLDTNEDTELASTKIQQIQAQLAEYSANIRNEQAEFNKENAKYQANVQAEMDKHNSDLQIAIANANNLAQEYRQVASQSVDIQKSNKAQDQALNISNAAKQMEKLISDNNNKLQKYSNELQSYQAQVGKLVQNAQGYMNEVQSRLQVDTAQYSWYEKQQAKLQADYDKGLQALS